MNVLVLCMLSSIPFLSWNFGKVVHEIPHLLTSVVVIIVLFEGPVLRLV